MLPARHAEVARSLQLPAAGHSLALAQGQGETMKVLLIVLIALVVIGATRGGHLAPVVHSTGDNGGPLLLVLVGMALYGLAGKQ
jgi:hypothetical protein